jgi:integration host factor subunit beta
MTKSELIEQLTNDNEILNKREAEMIVNSIFDSIGQALVDGDRVEIRGFGSFTVRERDAREARNPKSGEIVRINAKKTPFFKTGKELRERVNIF